MDKNIDAAELKEALKLQIDIISTIYQTQKAMYASVTSKDWSGTRDALEDIRSLTERFLEAGAKVSSIVGEDFIQYIENFPQEEKEQLTALLKELKTQILYSKTENDVFTVYVSHAKFLMQGMVNILSSGSTATCYTNTGSRSQPNLGSLMFNSIF